jgi:8-oxo-dGTP pyrophosphatase MutT (NUDIX family)
MMPPDLAAVLTQHRLLAQERVTWGETSLQVAGYLGSALPPPAYIQSVRAVVTCREEMLALAEGDRLVIFPGGGREPHETLEETLRREVGEESGWRLGPCTPFGVIAFRNGGPPPPNPRFPYAYPHFVNVIYLAEAVAYEPELLKVNEYEPVPYTFRPLAGIDPATLSPIARAFLEELLAQRSAHYHRR